MDSIGNFIKEYQALVRSNFDLFRSQESHHIDQVAWPKPQLKLLSGAVEREYFSMPLI